MNTLLDLEGILLLSSFTSEQTEPIANAISIGSEAHQLAPTIPNSFMLHTLFETWGSPNPDTLVSLNVALSTVALHVSPSVEEEAVQSAARYLAWVLPQTPRRVATSSFPLCSAVLQHPSTWSVLLPLVLSVLSVPSIPAQPTQLGQPAQPTQSGQPAQPAQPPTDWLEDAAALHLACAVADELPETTASELSQRVWDALLRARDDRAAYDAFCVDARRLGESGLGWQELAPSAWTAAELALVAAGADSLPQERLEALAQEALRHVKGAPTEVAEALCGLLDAALRQVEATSLQSVSAWRATVTTGGAFHQ